MVDSAPTSSSASNSVKPDLTGRAQELDASHKREMTEAEQLREEVNRTRALRASRQLNSSSRQSSISSSPIPASSDNTIKVSSSSFPVYAGRVLPTSSNNGTTGGTSLANFIGGDTRIKGPVLNKVRPELYAGNGLETDETERPTATFLSRLNEGKLGPGHFGKERVAMPGMVNSRNMSLPTPEPYTQTHKQTGTNAGKSLSMAAERPSTVPPALDALTREAEEEESVPLSRSPGPVENTQPRPGLAETKKASYTAEAISSMPKDADYIQPSSSSSTNAVPVLSPTPIRAFNPPSQFPAPASSQPASSTKPVRDFGPSSIASNDMGKQPTPSLTRLAGSNLVKQRLQWGESQNSTNSNSGSARTTPSSSPAIGSSGRNWSISNAGVASAASSPSSGKTAYGSGAKAEQNKEDSDSPKTVKRSSVLDRWNMDKPNEVTGSGSGGKSVPSSPQKQPSNAGYKSEYGVRSPDAYPLPTGKTSSLPAAEDTSYKAGYGVGKASGGSQGGFRPDYGIKSPAGSDVKQREADEPIQADTTPSESSEADKDETTSSAEPAKSASLPTPSSPSVVGTTQEATAPFNRPNKPPTWPKPQRSPLSPSFPSPSSSSLAQSSYQKPASLSTNNLPISVSPVSYSPSSATSPRSGTFQPSSTSFPVNLGIAPTHSRPTSLAHFIGADRKIQGPVLNKVRQGDALQGVDMGDEKGRKGTFLSAMNGGKGLLEEGRAKRGIPMPGMVPRQQEQEKTDQEITERSRTPTLPLPGSSSPRLPLPGEDSPKSFSAPLLATNVQLGQQELETEAGETATGQGEPLTIPGPSGSYSSSSYDIDANRSRSPRTYDSRNTNDSNDEPTMSRLLGTGYSTQRSIESIQPSERLREAGSDRLTAMQVSSEFTRQGVITSSPPVAMEANPWAQASEEESAAPKESKRSSIMVDKKEWQQTLKKLGNPARQAPRPPVVSDHHTPEQKKRFKVPPHLLAAAGYSSQAKIDLSVFSAPSKALSTYTRYISIDVLSISGSTATALPSGIDTFYSSELLAIVLRSKQGGLVTTDLHIWLGRHCIIGEEEEKKIVELESRYRTKRNTVKQGCESEELLRALGGKLVTRQGSREAFDSLNTTLYRVQKMAPAGKPAITLIDEVDMQRSSLCSASSFVASVFQDLFVWHGRGASNAERSAAIEYARELAGGNGETPIAEMAEGDEEEIWNDMMGEDEYASANHWRYRRLYSTDGPRVYVVNGALQASKAIQYLGDHTVSSAPRDSILLIELAFELFVLVPPSARAKRADIALALQAADSRSAALHDSGARPFKPPVHALILPSVLPLDLACCFRSTWFSDLNDPHSPVTMNVVDSQTGREQLSATDFSFEEIQDLDMLPLGLDPENIGAAR